MAGLLTKFLGIGTGISWIVYLVLFGIGVAAGTAASVAVEELRIHAVQGDLRAAKTDAEANLLLLKNANDNLRGLSASFAQAQAIITKQQVEADKVEADAAEIQRVQRAASTTLQQQLDAAKSQTSSIMQALKDAHHETPGQPIRDGFDPLVLVGIDRLSCLQRAGNAGGDPAACAGGSGISSGGTGAALDGTGAGNWRPTFEQQLWLVNGLFRLHDWGHGCVEQVKAIAKTQRTGPVQP